MVSVSNQQIPQNFRAHRPKVFQWLGKIMLSIFGWKVKGSIANEYSDKKLVVIFAHIHLIGMEF